MGVDWNVLLGAAGLVASTLTIVLSVNAGSRKQGERMAVIETNVGYLKEAVTDLKKSAGLVRRCTDCKLGRSREDEE